MHHACQAGNACAVHVRPFLLESLLLPSCICAALQVRPCNLVLGTEMIGSGGLVLGLHPNSTIRQPLDEALLKLVETGHTPGDYPSNSFIRQV
jgi:hypothetical protein